LDSKGKAKAFLRTYGFLAQILPYTNAEWEKLSILQNSDKQNARIEHDKALARVMTAVLKDDTELFKQFSDNDSFRRWLTQQIFELTYDRPEGGAGGHP
jgi:hypothetical protein